jgi:hypothetical protein
MTAFSRKHLDRVLGRRGGRIAQGANSWWRSPPHLVLIACALALAAGCTRSFYRNRADTEVGQILAQKDKYPTWAIQNWHVYPDPRARFATTDNPDRPAKPPDDPAAYDLSPNPQFPGKAGVARIEGSGYLDLIAQWDRENRQRQAEQGAEEQGERAEPPAAEEQGDPPTVAQAPPPTAPKDPTQPGSSAAQAAPPPAPKELPAQPGMNAAQAENKAILSATAPDLTGEGVPRTPLDIAGRPTYLLTLDQAAELAMFNSREYQDQRENLYLAALPVTVQRFSFTSQLFAAEQAIRESAGRTSTAGRTNNWTLNNGTGVAKVLPSGALLLLNFSNQTVFDFLNPKKTLSTSTLSFDAVQPFLRGGGRAVALEGLTQTERTLLYQIRTFARFRKELYVEIASNSGGSISGSAFQPTGVLSSGGGGGGGGGVSAGPVIGTLGNVATSLTGTLITPGSNGSTSLPTAITPAPTGYLNTMLQNIQVYIDKENIDVLNLILNRYRGLLEGDIVGPLQVQNVEQQLLTGRATLLSDQQQYLDALDSFKIEIGVPTQLSIEMDDSVLRPLMRQFRRSRAIIENEQAAVTDATNFIPLNKVPQVRAALLRLFEESALVRGTAFASNIRRRLAMWQRLSDKELRDRLEELRKETQKLLDLRTDLQNQGQAFTPADQARLRDLGSQTDLGNYERVLRKYEADYTENGRPKKLDQVSERRRVTQFRDVVSLWQKILVEARDERWMAIRKSWPDLPRCCVDGVDLIRDDLTRSEATAAQHALENRLDLMNVRAQVVDSWRQIALFANALLGTFNVRYSLFSNSPVAKAQPTDIGGSGNDHQLVLNTQLPIVRIQERNNYRTALIGYQRNRRTLEEAEDLAARAVRAEIHSLRVFYEQYKIQQRQLELAYLTIDSSLESLQAPTTPGPARAAQDGPAALTQQLLTAQRSLPTAQNALLTVWINYLDARLQLYRDLELMPLDARGVWIDEIRACDCGDPEQPPSSAGAGAPPDGAERLPEPKRATPAEPERLPEPTKPVSPTPGKGLE